MEKITINKPKTTDKITIPVYRYQDGEKGRHYLTTTGVIAYPIAIHRPLNEQEAIDKGERKRYGKEWSITHIPTGLSFGVSERWERVNYVAENIADHPALLMLTSETMQAHPMYSDLTKTFERLKREMRSNYPS